VTTLRIAHLSDLHFDGTPELREGLSALVRRVRAIEPDLVVVTGDLSASGRPSELDTVAEALASLEAVPRLVIPGNRDLVPSVGPAGDARPLPTDADLDFFLALEPAMSLGLEPADGGEAEDGSSPTSRWIERFGSLDAIHSDERLHVVGVDSNPRLRSATLERAARAMRDAAPGALRVFALHHALLPVPGRKVRDGDLSHRAGDVVALLLDLEVDLALHGHVHRAHAWQLSDGDRSLVVASAGALVNDGRLDASFLEIVAEDGRLIVTRRSVATGRATQLYDGNLGPAHLPARGR
jgi:3',5'-cyclic AMP phosphodiesterase CpdA